jgi:uncharacterized membrane protein
MSHISILPSIDLGLPFALKLNAFTIAKIILKLVIFKMIVKFITVICLLLFIPKLEIIKKKVNKDEDDEEERSSSPRKLLREATRLTSRFDFLISAATVANMDTRRGSKAFDVALIRLCFLGSSVTLK